MDAGEGVGVALLTPGGGPEGGDAVGHTVVVERAARVTLDRMKPLLLLSQ